MSILNKELIALNVEASDGADSIRKAGEIMEQGGYITKDYTEAMIQNFLKNGPYFAIAPGFAMPHARPEEGVIKAGIGIITLKTPVFFRNNNDPIKVLMPLATSHNQQHMEYLGKIAEILGRVNIIGKIYQCRTGEEVMELLTNNKEKEEEE